MSKLRMVACGGDDPFTSTSGLFKAGLDLTGRRKPRVLVIPTPAHTAEAHNAVAHAAAQFGQQTGLPVQLMHGFGELPRAKQARAILDGCDAVYVPTGNTGYMLSQWRSVGLDTILRERVTNGLVAITAGESMPCWFAKGHSDAERYEVPEGATWKYRLLKCIPLLQAVACPASDSYLHNSIERRLDHLQGLLVGLGHRRKAIGVDSTAALIIQGSTFRVESTGRPGLAHWFDEKGKVEAVDLAPSYGDLPLSMLGG